MQPMEFVARLPVSVGNIAFTPDNQMVFSHHPFFAPAVRVGRLTSPTTFEPFPSIEWTLRAWAPTSSLPRPRPAIRRGRGRLGLAHGLPERITPKLVGWNARANKLERIYYMPQPITRPSSQPQDLVKQGDRLGHAGPTQPRDRDRPRLCLAGRHLLLSGRPHVRVRIPRSRRPRCSTGEPRRTSRPTSSISSSHSRTGGVCHVDRHSPCSLLDQQFCSESGAMSLAGPSGVEASVARKLAMAAVVAAR